MNRKKIIESPVWDVGEVCVMCGSPYTQNHHIFGGTANRRVSDRMGYIIPLCAEHHTGRAGIHYNRGYDLFWKQTAQMHFEAHHGTRREFIEAYGKSWL